jgi:hypothetical protein
MNIREKICLYGDKYEDDINREKKKSDYRCTDELRLAAIYAPAFSAAVFS